MKKRYGYLLFLLGLILGVGSIFVFALILHLLDISVSPTQALLKKWGIYEDQEGKLSIICSLEDETLIQVSKKPKSNRLGSIVVIKQRVGSIFEYEESGDFGSPRALYTGGELGEGISWVDLDFNGELDQRYTPKGLQILINGEWVTARRKGKSAVTAQGIFEFDAGVGKWIRAKTQEVSETKEQ